MAPPSSSTKAGGLPLRHQKIQRLRRLVGRRSARAGERAFVAEGAKVVGEALTAGAPVEALYVAPTGRDLPVVHEALERGVPVFDLAPGVLERVAGTVTPQPVLAVVGYVDVPLEELRGETFLVVCVDVRDPGNLGTVLRSAEAAGAGGLVCCDGTVDVYNPKTVRASAGSLFHVRVVCGGNPVEVLEMIAGWGVRRLATAASGGHLLDDVDLRAPVALVMGNEAHGLPTDVASAGAVDELVTIPMAGRSESLNVGMATAVLAFEVARQRRAGSGIGIDIDTGGTR